MRGFRTVQSKEESSSSLSPMRSSSSSKPQEEDEADPWWVERLEPFPSTRQMREPRKVSRREERRREVITFWAWCLIFVAFVALVVWGPWWVREAVWGVGMVVWYAFVLFLGALFNVPLDMVMYGLMK